MKRFTVIGYSLEGNEVAGMSCYAGSEYEAKQIYLADCCLIYLARTVSVIKVGFAGSKFN